MTIARSHADRRPAVRRRIPVQGRRTVRARQRRAVQPPPTPFNPAVPLPAAAAGATPLGLALVDRVQLPHQQRQLSRRRAGGAAPARQLRQHQGDRQSAPGRARQPEGDDQGRRPHSDQPADASSAGPNSTFTTTAQYIDTGVLLQVTPHINAGGLVTLEVDAEVSTPGATSRSRPGAADQHPLGADAARGAQRADDGDGRAHHREQAEHLGRAAAHCRASRCWAACSATKRWKTTAPS